MIIRPPANVDAQGAAAVYAHVPEVREAWVNLMGVTSAFTSVTELEIDVQRLRSAFFHGCKPCKEGRAVAAQEQGMDEDMVARVVADFENAPGLSPRVVAGLRFTDRWVLDHARTVDDGVVAALREVYSDAEIIEMCAAMSYWESFHKFGAVFDYEAPPATYGIGPRLVPPALEPALDSQRRDRAAGRRAAAPDAAVRLNVSRLAPEIGEAIAYLTAAIKTFSTLSPAVYEACRLRSAAFHGVSTATVDDAAAAAAGLTREMIETIRTAEDVSTLPREIALAVQFGDRWNRDYALTFDPDVMQELIEVFGDHEVVDLAMLYAVCEVRHKCELVFGEKQLGSEVPARYRYRIEELSVSPSRPAGRPEPVLATA